MTKVYGAPPNHYSVAMELEEIEAKLRAETNEGSPLAEWYNMFFAPRMAFRIALGMGLQMLQQLTGANYFFYYGTVVFQATGINNSFVTQRRLTILVLELRLSALLKQQLHHRLKQGLGGKCTFCSASLHI
jgi:hypothetical protein